MLHGIGACFSFLPFNMLDLLSFFDFACSTRGCIPMPVLAMQSKNTQSTIFGGRWIGHITQQPPCRQFGPSRPSCIIRATISPRSKGRSVDQWERP